MGRFLPKKIKHNKLVPNLKSYSPKNQVNGELVDEESKM